MAGIRVKKRVFAGAVCEQFVFTAPARCKDVASAVPAARPRFANEADRQKHKDGISRRKFVRLVNANFSASSYYSTLTFDVENEVHDFDDARRIRNNYARRLQRACPDCRFAIVMGRGKNTNRIHMHMISDGVDPEIIRDKWGCGRVVDIKQLRAHCYYNNVDHGQDYTALAVYLHAHWTPEQGGHRWKASSNLREPEAEKTQEIRREYTERHPPRAPKGYIYIGCESTQYGCYRFLYVAEPGPDPKRPGRKRKTEV